MITNNQTQTPEDHHVGISLNADSGEKGVEGFSRDRKDRNLLTLDQAVVEINHPSARMGPHERSGSPSMGSPVP